MTFVDIIKSDKNMDFIVAMYDKKLQGLLQANEFYEMLNERFDVSWTNETWSRYTNVLYEVYNAFKGANKDRLIDLEVQRHKNVQTRREIREIARHKILEDYIEDLLDNKTPIKYFRKPTYVPMNEVVDIFVSDVHYKNDPEYIRQFGRSVEKRARGRNVTLHIVGDMVQGTLRLDDIYDGSIDVVQQAIEFSDELLNATKDLNIVGVNVYAGNHDELRLTNYKGSNNPSLGKMIAKYIEKSVDCNVRFVDDVLESDEMIVQHGHKFRGKKNMVDWGKTQNKTCIFGHYHSFGMDENVVLLPSLCDSDDYAKSLNLSSRMGYVIVTNYKQVEFVELKK